MENIVFNSVSKIFRRVCCRIVISCCFVAGLLSFASSAAILDLGNITRDTNQNLDFLDLPLTLARSFDDISGRLGPGGEFAGYRYATEDEVITLINNFGFSPGAVAGTNVTGDTGADQLSGLQNLLGVTHFDAATLSISSGGLTNTDATFGKRIVRIQVPGGIVGPVDDIVDASLSIPSDFVFSQVGSFLVRDSQPIPEPTTILLSAMGIIGVLGLRSRMKNS